MKSLSTIFGLAGAVAGMLLTVDANVYKLPAPLKTAMQITAAASIGVVGKSAADQKDLRELENKQNKR